jgi:hypothetical protein
MMSSVNGIAALVITLILASCSDQTHIMGGNLAPPPDSAWSRTFYGADLHFGCALEYTADGGFLITGQNTLYRLWITKLTAEGGTEWTSLPLDNWESGGNDVRQLPEGGYVITGGIGGVGGPNNVLLATVHAYGGLRWMRDFGGYEYDVGYDVELTPSGGFVLAGVTDSEGAGGRDAYVILTGSDGDSIWTHAYGQNYDDEARCIRVVEGGFIVAGRLGLPQYGAIHYSYWLFKLNNAGQVLWSRTYESGLELTCWGLELTADGGYLLAGTNGNMIGYPSGSAFLQFIKTDSLGNQEWITPHAFGAQLIGQHLDACADGGFLATGYVLDSQNFNNLFLMKTDALGVGIWQMVMGGGGDDRGTGVVETSDGSCAVSGFLTPVGAVSNFWVVKMD